AAPHERARSQRLADTLDHFCLLGLLGRGRRPLVRLLSQVHPPDDAVADELRGSAPRRDRGRGGNDRRADRWGNDRLDPEELRVGVSRTLEHAARLRLRADRDFHAGRCRAGSAPRLGALEQEMTAALNLRGLKKSFGGVPAMNDVSLDVKPGERRLIIGPNGAGKTTLFNLITGDLASDAGAIRLFGEEVSHLRPHQRAHRGLARTYQIITLFPKDSLEHNIVLALLGLSSVRWNAFRPLALETTLIEEGRRVLGLVGLDQRAARPIGEVSYGEKRRVEIAM